MLQIPDHNRVGCGMAKVSVAADSKQGTSTTKTKPWGDGAELMDMVGRGWRRGVGITKHHEI